MTVQIFQGMINDKDWDVLKMHAEFFKMFNFDQTAYTEFSVGYDFFADFFFTQDTIKYVSTFDNNSLITLYPEDVFSNALGLMSSSNLSKDQYATLFKRIIGILNNTQIHERSPGYYTNRIIRNRSEEYNANIYRVMLENPDLFEPMKPMYFEVDFKKISDFTPDEVIKFMEYVTGSPTIYNIDKLIDIFNGDYVHMINAMIVKGDQIVIRYIRNLIRDMALVDFENLMSKIDKSSIAHSKLRELYMFYVINKIEVPESVLIELYPRAAAGERTDIYKFASVMSTDALKQYCAYENTSRLATAGLDIDAIANLKGTNKLYDISNTVFFTEEEIIAHPYFFDPAEVKKKNLLYVSKSTFALLNRTWGKRQKWTSDLINGEIIIGKIPIDMLVSDIIQIAQLKYIQRKSNAKNTGIFNTISGFGRASGANNNFKILNKLKKEYE